MEVCWDRRHKATTRQSIVEERNRQGGLPRRSEDRSGRSPEDKEEDMRWLECWKERRKPKVTMKRSSKSVEEEQVGPEDDVCEDEEENE